MAYKRTVKIVPKLPGTLDPSNEQDIKEFLYNYSKNYHIPKRIATIYYFTKEKIIDPIYGEQKISGQTVIHPGKSRYIGAALKKEPTSLHGFIYTLRNPIDNDQIEWLGPVEQVVGNNTRSLTFKHLGTGFQNYASEYLIKKSHNARIELILDDRATVIHNFQGSWTIKEDCRITGNVLQSLKNIFSKLDNL
jgi:hypothetical protein